MDEQELKINIDIDYMKLLYEDNDISIVECLVLHEGVNRKKCNIPHQTVLDALPSLANKPIWGIPNSKFFRDSSTDFVEHARSEEENKEVMIFGTFPESAVKNAEFIEFNNKIYLKVQAILWKRYAPIAMRIFNSRNGNTKISVEINAKGKQDIYGIFNIERMVFLSAVCLGLKIPEGIKDSQLNITKFTLDETIENFNQQYISSFSNEDKFTIPESIKNNAKEALALRKKHGRGGTSVQLTTAKYLANNEYISYENIQKFSKYFSRNKNKLNNLEISDISSNTFIELLLNGGEECRKWFEEIIDTKLLKNTNTTEFFVKKEAVGTKTDIKINKNKDSISNSSWGDEDKSSLKKDCLMASNYKTLCKAVFLKCEKEFEEGLEGALGYPVMEKISDEVVYNRNGLASAKAYATKNNETEILSKLKLIYNHLSLPWDEDEKKNKEEDKNMSEEIVKNAEDVVEVIKSTTEEEIKNAENTNNAKPADKIVEEIKNTEVESDFCKNCNSLTEELKMANNELIKYKKAEEEQKMYSLLETFSHCYSAEEKEVLKNEVSKFSFGEFEKKVDTKIKEFALRVREEKTANKEDAKGDESTENNITFSVSPFGVSETYDFSKKSGEKNLDSIIKDCNIKIK